MPATLLSVSDADHAAFRQRNDAVMLARLRKGLYFGVFVGLVLAPATWWTRSKVSPEVLLLPVAASGVMAAASFATRLPGIVPHATALCCAISYGVGILGALAAAKTGGFQSPYFHVHFLICTFATAYLPLSPRTLLLVCLPNSLLTPAIILGFGSGNEKMLLPVLFSTCGLVYAYLGVVVRSRADLQSFVAHARLAETQASLAELNQELARRVDEQVAEIVRRADDVDALNAQLREKVQMRSRELARALRALNHGHDGDMFPAGTLLAGRVLIEGTIGAGGMGTVYVGQDRVSGRRVAVKVMSAGVLASPRSIQRFLAEAEAAAAISHPGIVKTLHVDVDSDGTLFQIMEYVDGTPLHLIAGRSGKFAPGLVARIGEAIARALAAAHEVGIVHRDVKPSNVMIARTPPPVRLFDFGVSKMDRGGDDVERTATGALIGTPAYMAPEQGGGSSAVTPACDVYSLGIVLYELAAGRHPFAAKSGIGLLLAHATEEPAPLHELDPSFPADLSAQIASAMAKSPAERPGALQLADALGRLVGGAPEVGSLLEAHDSEVSVTTRGDLITSNRRAGLTMTTP